MLRVWICLFGLAPLVSLAHTVDLGTEVSHGACPKVEKMKESFWNVLNAPASRLRYDDGFVAVSAVVVPDKPLPNQKPDDLMTKCTKTAYQQLRSPQARATARASSQRAQPTLPNENEKSSHNDVAAKSTVPGQTLTTPAASRSSTAAQSAGARQEQVSRTGNAPAKADSSDEEAMVGAINLCLASNKAAYVARFVILRRSEVNCPSSAAE